MLANVNSMNRSNKFQIGRTHESKIAPTQSDDKRFLLPGYASLWICAVVPAWPLEQKFYKYEWIRKFTIERVKIDLVCSSRCVLAGGNAFWAAVSRVATGQHWEPCWVVPSYPAHSRIHSCMWITIIIYAVIYKCMSTEPSCTYLLWGVFCI